MKRANAATRSARHVSGILAWLALLAAIACDNEVNFNPTTPSFPFTQTSPNSALGESRQLEITGTLTADEGACLEATVLFDGEELSGARITCPETRGCATLTIAAKVQSGAGPHTIAFQVLRQSDETIRYRAEGSVRVTREGLPGFALALPLGPTTALLRERESVHFDVAFSS